jgi:hypothetical protein
MRATSDGTVLIVGGKARAQKGERRKVPLRGRRCGGVCWRRVVWVRSVEQMPGGSQSQYVRRAQWRGQRLQPEHTVPYTLLTHTAHAARSSRSCSHIFSREIQGSSSLSSSLSAGGNGGRGMDATGGGGEGSSQREVLVNKSWKNL